MVEAKRRDHRVLGKKLDLFSLQEDAGGGLVSKAQDQDRVTRFRHQSKNTCSTRCICCGSVLTSGILRIRLICIFTSLFGLQGENRRKTPPSGADCRVESEV